MSENQKCADCGCELKCAAFGGLCPQCLLMAGLGHPPEIDASQTTEVVQKSASNGFVPPEPAELADLIPHVEILELLGQGGMGAVYKGRQRSLDRFVAVKILSPEISHDPRFAERFTREARALGRLTHPNIVAIHDSGCANGLYYFVMEYVDGSNLRQLMEEKKLAPGDVLAIVPQVCAALQYAHDEGIVHRDIKPENILIDKKERVKIADFGLAKLLNQDEVDVHLTATNQVMGTPKYMAPEQMEGAKEIDHRADIYSLGVVFYELLTGELPLGRFAPPSKRVPLDLRLDEIVLRALERRPEQRYQQAGEVKTEIESVVQSPKESAPGLNTNASLVARTNWVTRLFWGLIADLDEIDRPYVSWVVCPLLGFLGYYIFAAFLQNRFAKHTVTIEGFFVFGTAWSTVVFVLLNLIWLVCWTRHRNQALEVRSLTAEEIDEQIGRGAFWLRVVGFLTFVGWIMPVPLPEFDGWGIKIAWALLAGSILCLGARSLGKRRKPSVLPFLVAMAPFSPAVMLGLPLSLRMLRMMSRPEVKAHFEAPASANSSDVGRSSQ